MSQKVTFVPRQLVGATLLSTMLASLVFGEDGEPLDLRVSFDVFFFFFFLVFFCLFHALTCSSLSPFETRIGQGMAEDEIFRTLCRTIDPRSCHAGL